MLRHYPGLTALFRSLAPSASRPGHTTMGKNYSVPSCYPAQLSSSWPRFPTLSSIEGEALGQFIANGTSSDNPAEIFLP